jgi:hypothetical protein
MRSYGRVLAISVLLGGLLICRHQAHGADPVTIDLPGGARITYGSVAGATTQGDAMLSLLRFIHRSHGDRPSVGNAFRFRDTDSVGIFFTLMNRQAGNVEVAGLIIVAQNGPNQVEAALLTDRSDRFGKSINPMLTKVYEVWHPAGLASVNGPSTGPAQPAAPAAVAPSGPVPPMRKVMLPDRTASISLPDGWNITQESGGGTIFVAGPSGEKIVCNAANSAQDPTNSGYQRFRQNYRGPVPANIVMVPFNADFVRNFRDLYLRICSTMKFNPGEVRVDSAEALPAAQGAHCVRATLHINPPDSGPTELGETLCACGLDPTTGFYHFEVSLYRLPVAVADRQRATAVAILSTFEWDEALVRQRANADVAPVLASMKKSWDDQQRALIAGNQAIAAGIRQTGENALARARATQQMYDQQHRDWERGQVDRDRTQQGFHNYILDQTVIRDIQDPNTHATVWNRTAEVWQKAFPDRIEQVPVQQYIQGRDF